MEMKLISMVDFILEIDWMSTAEFCEKYHVPVPNVNMGANGLLQVDAVKHRMFLEYAKFLNKKLTIDMFEGDKKIFTGGQYVDLQPSRDWNYFHIRGKKIFQDNNTQRNASLGYRISDLTSLELSFQKTKPYFI